MRYAHAPSDTSVQCTLARRLINLVEHVTRMLYYDYYASGQRISLRANCSTFCVSQRAHNKRQPFVWLRERLVCVPPIRAEMKETHMHTHRDIANVRKLPGTRKLARCRRAEGRAQQVKVSFSAQARIALLFQESSGVQRWFMCAYAHVVRVCQ